MSSIRQQVLFRTLFIVVIVIPTILYKPENKFLVALEILILFYGLYQFIRLAAQFQRFIDDLYPPKLSRKAKVEKIHKLFFYGSQVLFYCAIFFHLGISWWTRDTIFAERLIMISFLFGLVIAAIVTLIIYLRKPSIYYESTRRLTVHFGIFFGISLLFSALAIFTNHLISDNIISCNIYTVEQKSKIGRYNSPWIYITIENKKERLKISSKLYDSLDENGKVNICTKKGLLGYRFVDEIKIVN